MLQLLLPTPNSGLTIYQTVCVVITLVYQLTVQYYSVIHLEINLVVLGGVTVITDTMIAIVELILIHLTATCSNTKEWRTLFTCITRVNG